MRLLLDTHTLIWHHEANPALSDKARDILNLPDSQLFISTASIWEMAIKISSGKLKLRKSLKDIINIYQNIGAAIMPVKPDHALGTESLPWHHRDPFDRLLIAQAIYEDLTLVSRDEMFARYPIIVLW
jgi:PIN domain nuclease of toxin-antitoxin system